MDVISISDTSSSSASSSPQPLDASLWKYSCQGTNEISGKPMSSKSSVWMIHSCQNKRKTFTISDSQVSNSDSTEPFSATWSNKDSFNLINSDVNETPCTNTKVNSWLNECNLSKSDEDYNQICYLQLPDVDGTHLEKPLKGSILIRHDFKKDKVSNANWIDGEKNADGDDFNSIECTNDKVSARSLSCHSEENLGNDLIDALKIEQKCLIEVPLSPETQKKNELCSYLQLMNMHATGKKIRNVSQQRRSTRVKNLIILSEKRKLEEKLHVESIERQKLLDNEEVADDNRSLSMKSFAELNINVLVHPDKILKMCVENVDATQLFKGFPAKLLHDRCDFDETMVAFMRNENITASKLNERRKLRRKPSKWKSKVLFRSAPTSNAFLRSHKSMVNIGGQTKQLRWTRERMLRRRQFRKYIKQKDKKKPVKPKAKIVNNSSRSPIGKINDAPDANESIERINGEKSNSLKPNSIVHLNNLNGRIIEENKSELNIADDEKSFNIIDLSHTINSNACTLHDHDYTAKSQIDTNYIMNVILGETNDVTKNDPQKFLNDYIENSVLGVYNVIGNSYLNEEQIYEKNVLEEIIGVPWNSKSSITNKNEEVIVNSIGVCKGPKEIPPVGNRIGEISIENDKVNNVSVCISEHSYSVNPVVITSENEESIDDVDDKSDSSSVSGCSSPSVAKIEFVPVEMSPTMKSLHKNLVVTRSRTRFKNLDLSSTCDHIWDTDSPPLHKQKDGRKSYSVCISESDGLIINACYVDYNLIVAQEQMVSFWTQSALGNMLGAQNMWISKGSVHRLALESNCVHQKSCEMVVSLENSLAYIELWTKEHKSDKRQQPVADVFATVYFWRQRQNGPSKKVLQLENIKGFASDVQYIVLRNSRNIIVSWNEMYEDKRRSVVHCYNLAPDFQTVINIREIESVDHYISSLHNIEDCDNLIMGHGNYKMTFWNLEGGYIVSTIEINDIKTNPRTLWVKCDRGFVFTLQHYETERLFKLIAINGINESWKRLQIFRSPYGYSGLRGVCVDNNILVAFFQNGIICWNVQSGESVIEEISSEVVFMPSRKHVIMSTSDGILVQHALSYCITNYDL